MFARLAILLYAVVSYAVFTVSFLYALGFVGNYVVPKSMDKSIDVGSPANLGEAILINLLLLSLFAIQHSVMARPAFKRWWTRILPVAPPAQHLCAALQPDPPPAVLAMASRSRHWSGGPSGIAAWLLTGVALARLADRIRLDLHDRSFRSVRPAPGLLRAARDRDAQPVVQDAAALQDRAASAHAGLSARVLGHASR